MKWFAGTYFAISKVGMKGECATQFSMLQFIVVTFIFFVLSFFKPTYTSLWFATNAWRNTFGVILNASAHIKKLQIILFMIVRCKWIVLEYKIRNLKAARKIYNITLKNTCINTIHFLLVIIDLKEERFQLFNWIFRIGTFLKGC